MTAKIISMMNQKGGSGKSTTSQHSAITMATTGKKVLIVDTDPQLTCYKFFVKNHEAFPNGYDGVIDVVKADVDVLLQLIIKYKSSYDYIFIDTAPALGIDMSLIIKASDLVVICTQPKFKDIEATEAIVKAFRAGQANDKKLKGFFCITRRKNKVKQKHIDKLNNYGLPIMTTQIRDYVAYDDADELGLGMIHLDKIANADKAASDIHEFTTELTAILGA